MTDPTPLWRQLCAAKKQQQGEAIPSAWRLAPQLELGDDVRALPRSCGILSERELEITELDEVGTLLEHLASGRWSAVEVTTAYLKRALIAHQLVSTDRMGLTLHPVLTHGPYEVDIMFGAHDLQVNCLTEFWIDDALVQARELDERLRTSGPIGPLHGLPISLKDQFHIKGKELNMGLASWLGRISTEDAVLVTCLRRAGAIVYVRTNVPQTLMKPETDNHVYGVTTNPANRRLTPGGSSGGEGALLALKGSPLGVGSDIGGSIRIPAAYNGLYGLRPTSRRVPYAGAANTLLGLEAIESVFGPLARTLNGCAIFMKAVADAKPWDLDPKVVELEWKNDQYLEPSRTNGPLCFGYYADNEHVCPLPPVRRAIQMTVDALRAAGHTVIPFKPERRPEMDELTLRIYAAGGADDLKATFVESGETLIQGIRLDNGTSITVHDSWALTQKRDSFRRDFLRQWMDTSSVSGTGRPIDAIVCPMAPCPPPPLGKNIYAGYTQVYNLLDFPAVVVPVTTVDPVLDVADEQYTAHEPRNPTERAFKELYTGPEVFRGAPVAVQVVGRRYREEALLGIAGEVDRALRSREESSAQ